jgi:ribosomal protein S18 acetylase RimI-like enzyme
MLSQREQETAMQEHHIWANIQSNQHIIGYLKIGFNRVFINDYRQTLTFSPDVAYIYDTYILPSYRHQRVASVLIHDACHYLQTKEFSRVLCHIPPWNQASARLYGKTGFRIAQSISACRVVGKTILSFNPTEL